MGYNIIQKLEYNFWDVQASLCCYHCGYNIISGIRFLEGENITYKIKDYYEFSYVINNLINGFGDNSKISEFVEHIGKLQSTNGVS